MGKSKIGVEDALLDQVDRGGRPNPQRVHYPRRRSFASNAETGFEPGVAPARPPTTGSPRNSPGDGTTIRPRRRRTSSASASSTSSSAADAGKLPLSRSARR